VALISTLPDWRIHVPGHPDEVEAILRSVVNSTSRDYIRLAESVNSEAIDNFGGFSVVRRGSGSAVTTVIAVGPSLQPTLDATVDLDATILYASTIRPFDAKTLRDALAAPAVVLVEPYLAGTSSAEVSAALVDTPHRLLALGVPCTEHRHYGSRAQHHAAYGLDAAGIRRSIDGFLAAPAPR
jgi:transketolase